MFATTIINTLNFSKNVIGSGNGGSGINYENLEFQNLKEEAVLSLLKDLDNWTDNNLSKIKSIKLQKCAIKIT